MGIFDKSPLSLWDWDTMHTSFKASPTLSGSEEKIGGESPSPSFMRTEGGGARVNFEREGRSLLCGANRYDKGSE